MSNNRTAVASAPANSQPNATGRRRTSLLIAIAIISLLGLADAIYLTIEHITGQSVRCTITSGCSEVLSSSYSVMFGVPLAAIGATAYFSVFSLATLAAFGYRVAAYLLTALVTLMFITSLWLIYLQAFVIHAFCQFCLFSAAVTITLTILVFVIRRMSDKL